MATAINPLGSLADLLVTMGSDAAIGGDDALMLLPIRRVHAGSALFHEGGVADTLYVVRSGSLRCQTVAEDGYLQVLGFAAAGELVGFDALAGGRHRMSAVAMEECLVYALPAHDIEALRHALPALDHALTAAMARQLGHAAEIAELMAAVSAEVRVARFLVQLRSHMAVLGQSSERLLLRMNRRDIASYLGLAHETVSRAFGALADAGHVRVHNREIDIVDADGLLACSRSTRRPMPDGRQAESPSRRAGSEGHGQPRLPTP